MLRVQMTPNLLGFKISGDYDDLNELYDAIWDLTVKEDDDPNDRRSKSSLDEIIMSTRLLALNYDLRHAYQGDRGIELVDSGMSEWVEAKSGTPLVKKNVLFTVNVLYPEAMYELLVINYLVFKRIRDVIGRFSFTNEFETSEKLMTDTSIWVARAYVAKVLAAVQEEATPGRFSRLRKACVRRQELIPFMYQQWLDDINADYCHMTPKERAQNLNLIVQQLVDHLQYEDYHEMTAEIDDYAKERGIDRSSVYSRADRIPEIADSDW